MLLSVFERANIINILPKEGNFKTLKTLRKLKEDLSLSEEEVKKWQPSFSEEGIMKWRVLDEEGNQIEQDTDIELSELSIELIAEILRKLDSKKQLKEEHFSLYEKFVAN